MTAKIRQNALEALYHNFNNRDYAHPDPIVFLYQYKHVRDREVAGLIASCLAYGRVAQIMKTVTSVLNAMGPSPYQFVRKATDTRLRRALRGFRHRFTSEQELRDLILGARCAIEQYGSLENALAEFVSPDDDTIAPALPGFASLLNAPTGRPGTSLMPCPARGSACKRLNLFLRWMIRKDNIDPGGWTTVSPAKLIVPLDTHLHRICTALSLTDRKSADMRTAIEITYALRRLDPEDPVKYDFGLTRFGIRGDIAPGAAVAWLTGRGPEPEFPDPSKKHEAELKFSPASNVIRAAFG